jgi:hypothetical protein
MMFEVMRSKVSGDPLEAEKQRFHKVEREDPDYD